MTTNKHTNNIIELSLDEQDLRETLEDEHYAKLAVSVGDTACGCAPEPIVTTEATEPKKSNAIFIRDTFNPDSIDFIRDGASLIVEPRQFLERVEAIQGQFSEDIPKPSLAENASELKRIVGLTQDLENVSKQMLKNFQGKRLKNPERFKESLVRRIRIIEKSRMQVYQDSFGYNPILNQKYLTKADFKIIFESDMRNLRGILRSDTIPYYLDSGRITRYLKSIDEYVASRSTPQ